MTTAWTISAVPLPDGDRPTELWVGDDGRLTDAPVAGAQQLPGRYVLPGLVDAHAHPTVGGGADGPRVLDAAGSLEVLSAWAAQGVTLIRDVGSPGGLTLTLEPGPGRPEVVAAGRFLAPAGRYFPQLLPEPAAAAQLADLAVAELGRGARWVKLIADFPPVVDGVPGGPAEPTYPMDAVLALTAAVHAAGGRVAAHCTTDQVADLVRAGIDSIEHGTSMDEAALHHMAETGAAWTPTLTAVLGGGLDVPAPVRRWRSEQRERMAQLLPLAHRLGVPVLAGTDTAGPLAGEIALLGELGLAPTAALAAASTTALDFLGRRAYSSDRATLVTYASDPREDLDVLARPAAVLIDGIRVR